jgi:serine protease AprX
MHIQSPTSRKEALLRVLVALPLVFCALTSGSAYSSDHFQKISQDLQTLDPGSSVDVIVQFNQVPTEEHFDRVRARGGNLKSRLDIVNGALFTIPSSALSDLAEDPAVVYISPDRQVRCFLNHEAPAVNAEVAWQLGWTGAGIGIALIDSGITMLPDLTDPETGKPRVVFSQAFTGETDLNDEFGHGTHVAGIAAGDGAMSTGPLATATFRGIAPGAHLINLKVLDQNGSGSDSSVIAAIDQAIQLKKQYNIRVINLSLGRPVFESYTLDPLCQAVEAAWKAGIVVVVAAGNDGRGTAAEPDGYGTITAPGNDPYVITVGAMKTMAATTRSDDLIASYSSKGPTLIDHVVKPDIVAPGNCIVSLLVPGSTLVKEYPGNVVPYSYYTSLPIGAKSPWYFRLSGTSMAAPVVSGAATLLLQQNPSLTPDQVKARLMMTAAKNFPTYSIATDPTTHETYASQYDIFTVGAGYLDIAAALTSSDSPKGAALSPTVVYDPATGQVDLQTGSAAVWGNSGAWSKAAVWGTLRFVNGAATVWGTAAVWGTHTTEGLPAVSGTSFPSGSESASTPSTNAVSKGKAVAILGEN